MKWLAALPLLLTGTLAQQSFNQTYVTDLVAALSAAGFTKTSSVLQQMTTAKNGDIILSALSNTNRTWSVFVPSDAAWEALFPAGTDIDASGLAGALAYHIVSGNFTGVKNVFPNTTIGRTLLNPNFTDQTVHLEGNLAQVLAWTQLKSDNATHILNQNTANVTVIGNIKYQNLEAYAINAVLGVPGNISNALAVNNLTMLSSILSSLNTTVFDATTNTSMSISLLDALNTQAHGFTLFAPSDAALTAAAPQIAAIANNATAIMAILGNHIINGTTVYSPSLTGKKFTSASGEDLTSGVNSLGNFVKSGNSNASITTPDVLLFNGVVHVINGVLFNNETNSGAASSAFNSATSVAATAARVTETGPVGVGSSGSGGSGSGSGSGSGGSGKSAATLPIVPIALAGVATFLAGAFMLA